MEHEIENKPGIIEKLTSIFIKRKKSLISLFILTIFSIIGFKFFDYYKENKNKEISEKFIKAGIYLSSDKKNQSKEIYKDIIRSKNKFYSILALNNIIENNLEESSDEILELFNQVESIKIEKDQKDLIKLKKALYLFKISKFDEGNALLKKIIANNSKWKNIALELIR